MKGKVLEFNSASRTGTISADDGNRCRSARSLVRACRAGSRVDFSANAKQRRSHLPGRPGSLR